MRKKLIKPKYLACIWCGGNLPAGSLEAKYCSQDCRNLKTKKPFIKNFKGGD
jgi:predicted nucleic acid-binding Zn ribbon protein